MKRLKGRLHLTGQTEDGAEGLIALREVCIGGDAKLLRKLGRFLIECSKQIDEQDHFHFSDYGGDTDVVVTGPPPQGHAD